MEHSFWFAVLLNKLLAGVVTPVMLKVGVTPADRAQPIPGYLAGEILVILMLVFGALILRRRLSVDNPGGFQQAMELVVEFVQSTAAEIIEHGSSRYTALLGTLFLFVLVCNLFSLFPTFGVAVPSFGIEVSPTGFIQATLGCAVVAFLYYNFQGVRHHGPLGYLKHLSGPFLAMAIIMFPIEVIGNVGRLLSLSVRLYANMLVGGLLERVFGGLVPVVVPVLFMALHIFVSLLQAYIFMLLPAVYIGLAVAEEH